MLHISGPTPRYGSHNPPTCVVGTVWFTVFRHSQVLNLVHLHLSSWSTYMRSERIYSGRITATSHNLTSPRSWGRKIFLFSGKSRLVKYHTLARYILSFCIETCSHLHLSWCTSLSLDMHVLPVSRTQLEAAQGAYHVTCCSGRAVDDITHKKLYRILDVKI